MATATASVASRKAALAAVVEIVAASARRAPVPSKGIAKTESGRRREDAVVPGVDVAKPSQNPVSVYNFTSPFTTT